MALPVPCSQMAQTDSHVMPVGCIRFSDGHTMPTSGLMPDSQSTLDHFKSGFLMAPPGSNDMAPPGSQMGHSYS